MALATTALATALLVRGLVGGEVADLYRAMAICGIALGVLALVPRPDRPAE